MIQVAGHKIQIAYLPVVDHDGECSGWSSPFENRIEVSLAECTTEEEILACLFHELVHVVLHKSGTAYRLGDSEEAVVILVEELLWPILRFDRRKWRKNIEVEIDG